MADTPLALAEQPLVLISSFTGGDQGGIQAYSLKLDSGELVAQQRTAGIENPFFFDLSPDQKTVYTIDTKSFGGPEPGNLAAFRLDSKDGRMTLLNRQSTQGTASCFVEVDQTGKSVLVANYSSGDVISYSVGTDGSLASTAQFVRHAGSSVNPSRQKEPHAHCFVISPNNRFAYAADLGIDKIVCYALDPSTAKLTPNVQPFTRTLPGAGPRHLTFHPNGKWMYVINELLNSVTRFDYSSETGVLIEQQTISTLPQGYTEVSHTADLKITPNGKYLYGTNRGHDSIACYRIADNGELSLIEITPSQGKGPQNLAITSDGRWLICANMPGNNVAVFRIGDDGAIKSAGTPIAQIGPACIRILQ